MNTYRPKAEMNRAGLLSFALALGCAKTPSNANPEAPQDAPTTTRRESVSVDGTNLDLFLPSDAAPPLPAVLMFHSAMGPTDTVRSYAGDLAKQGFAVCVLDFYNGRVAENVEQAIALRDDANDRLPAITDLVHGTYEVLRSDPRVLAKRRYLLGWSYGGAWATYAAGKLDDVAGVVAIYGENFSGNPSLYERFSVPLLLVGATRDAEPSAATLREVRDTLVRRGVSVSVVLLDADHGFMEASHPGYAKESAARAWKAVGEFLRAREGDTGAASGSGTTTAQDGREDFSE